MSNVQVVNAGRSRGARREVRMPALALAVLVGLVAPTARAQSSGARAPPPPTEQQIRMERPPEAPPPPPEVPADAPTVTSAPDIKVSMPNRSARLTPGDNTAPGQQVYEVGSGRLLAFGIIGVPLTWAVASAGAFTAGVIGFAGALGLTQSSDSSTMAGVPLGASFAVGSLVGVLITYYMLPGLMGLFCDDAKMVGSVEAARDAGWMLGRWGVLGMSVTSVGMIVGGLARNEGLLAAAAVGWAISYLIAWSLEIAGVIDGYSRSYRPRSAPSRAVPSEALPSGDDRL